MSPALSFEKKRRNAARGLRVGNDIVLNQFRVYHERVYADNVVSYYWIVGSFSLQHHYNSFANIAPGNVSPVRTKEGKTRSFSCNVNPDFLSSTRHFQYEAAFNVIVTFLT